MLVTNIEIDKIICRVMLWVFFVFVLLNLIKSCWKHNWYLCTKMSRLNVNIRSLIKLTLYWKYLIIKWCFGVFVLPHPLPWSGTGHFFSANVCFLVDLLLSFNSHSVWFFPWFDSFQWIKHVSYWFLNLISKMLKSSFRQHKYYNNSYIVLA